MALAAGRYARIHVVASANVGLTTTSHAERRSTP